MAFSKLKSQPNDITENILQMRFPDKGIFIVSGYKRVTFLLLKYCNHYGSYYVEKDKMCKETRLQ